jgi:hypothetical protein
VAGEGLRDDVHAVGDDAAEDGRRHDVPQLPRLLPHPRREVLLLLAALAAAAVRVQQRHPARVRSLHRRLRLGCSVSPRSPSLSLQMFLAFRGGKGRRRRRSPVWLSLPYTKASEDAF